MRKSACVRISTEKKREKRRENRMKIQRRYFGYNYSYLSDYYEGKHDSSEHIHHFIEISCILEGEIEITVNGVTEFAKMGDVVVIFPFQPHSHHTPEHCKMWISLFSPTWVSEFFPRDTFYIPQKNVFTPSPSTFAYVTEKTPPPYWLPPPKTPKEQTFRRIKALYYALLEDFLQNVTISSSVLNADVLSKVYLYINEHYTESDLTVKKVAVAIGYTPNYISACLSVIPNANFRTILNSARVENAKQLLITTDMKISDIALESGFSSENVFYGIFEKHVGKTPRQYRISKKDHK